MDSYIMDIMKSMINISNQKFGKLTAIKPTKKLSTKGEIIWECKCDCGNQHEVIGTLLRNNRVQSCGCTKRDGSSRKSHGMTKTRFYRTWHAIKLRCNREKTSSYKDYGGRGITCKWTSFTDFYNDMYISYTKHVAKYGSSNTSIDRIDVNGHYCKENCRWATKKEQMQNRRNTVFIEYKGKKKTIVEWSQELGINYQTLYWRYVKAKYSPEKSLNLT